MKMYSNIKNPKTNQWVSLHSYEGKQILKNYLLLLTGGYLDDNNNQDDNNKDDNEDVTVEISNKEQFDSIVLENDYTVLNGYADWCGHCTKYKPEYIQISNELNAENNNKKKIKFVKWNLGSDRVLSSELGVTGYPTLLLFKKNNSVGEKIENRNKEGIKLALGL